MNRILPAVFLSLVLCLGQHAIEQEYEVSYTITGDARGRILLIFPYRVFYTSSASLIFQSTVVSRERLFRLKAPGDTGYMMRTMGFSGRSLGVITADNDKTAGRIVNEKFLSEFPQTHPEYARYIKKSHWNHFGFGKIADGITFIRSENGINRDMKYNLTLNRSDEEKPLRIQFNIYKILGEIIRSYNHPVLPRDFSPKMISGEKTITWESGDIDFSETLSRSTLHAASIFKKISPLKQEKPFRIKYSAFRENGSILAVTGISRPGVSVWHDFRILIFARDARIRISDMTIISDSIFVEVRDDSGKGGTFRSAIVLLEKQN